MRQDALERLSELVSSVVGSRWASLELELETMLKILRGELPDEIKWLKYRSFIVSSYETLSHFDVLPNRKE